MGRSDRDSHLLDTSKSDATASSCPQQSPRIPASPRCNLDLPQQQPSNSEQRSATPVRDRSLQPSSRVSSPSRCQRRNDSNVKEPEVVALVDKLWRLLRMVPGAIVDKDVLSRWL